MSKNLDVSEVIRILEEKENIDNFLGDPRDTETPAKFECFGGRAISVLLKVSFSDLKGDQPTCPLVIWNGYFDEADSKYVQASGPDIVAQLGTLKLIIAPTLKTGSKQISQELSAIKKDMRNRDIDKSILFCKNKIEDETIDYLRKTHEFILPLTVNHLSKIYEYTKFLPVSSHLHLGNLLQLLRDRALKKSRIADEYDGLVKNVIKEWGVALLEEFQRFTLGKEIHSILFKIKHNPIGVGDVVKELPKDSFLKKYYKKMGSKNILSLSNDEVEEVITMYHIAHIANIGSSKGLERIACEDVRYLNNQIAHELC